MSGNRTIILRRLTALLLFAMVLIAFAALFFLKIVPGNMASLNNRGHKALTQQVQNFLRKDQDLHNIIENVGKHFTDLVNQKPPYDRLHANIPYTSAKIRSSFKGHLLKTDTGVWVIVHYQDTADLPGNPKKTARARLKDTVDTLRPCITIKTKDFADPIFAGQDDVFKDYLILLDSADTGSTGEGRPVGLSLIYQQLPLSASARINADTTAKLTPNSDQSGSFALTMAGENYIAYFSRFEFHWHHLILVGLIDAKEYNRKLDATPPWFLPLVIILMALVLIVLPFLKVFLLSPHECITGGDVFRMALCFYAGGVAVTIIAFYFFLNYVTGMSLATRLTHLSRLVRSDVEQEIASANEQLKTYDYRPGELSPLDSLKRRLAKDLDAVSMDSLQRSVDAMCIPRTNLLVSRIFWLDTTGRTIAKWSPFTYPTPFTRLHNQVFYKLLIMKPPAYDGVAGVDEPVLYPGKSNLTAELFNFIGRASRTRWLDSNGKKIDTAAFIVIADVLRASLQPVIPPGFSFSIIDNTGNILVDGDSRKSLGGNLFEESMQDRNLLDAVRFDKTGWQFPMQLRGKTYYANITPIAGQPLHLVCYYSQDIVGKNVNRMMHFSIHSLVLLWCLLAICLLLSTFNSWKPMILKFKFEKVDWIRPASTNTETLPAIYHWMLWLSANAVAWSAGVALTSATLTPLFYLALLFPFYVVLGAQVFHTWVKIYTALSLVLLNGLIVWMTYASASAGSQEIPVLCFQALTLLGLWDASREKGWIRQMKVPGGNEYFRILHLSILLISILPTLDILTYAFYAEKVQFKKAKLDVLSTAFTKRSNYLLTNFIPSHKAIVQRKFDTPGLQRLLFNSSIYLTDQDLISPSGPNSCTDTSLQNPPDALYELLMDRCYLAPLVWDDEPTIPDGGHAGHGMYSLHGTTVRYSPGRVLANPGVIADSMVLTSHLQSPLTDLKDISAPVQLLVLGLIVIFALLARTLVKGAINHVFLMEIVTNIEERFKNKTTEIPNVIKLFGTGKPSWMPELNTLGEITLETLELERSFAHWPKGKSAPPDPCLQTDFILAMADYLKPAYNYIFWKLLATDEERYILFDFATDKYTNYKNSAILYRLIAKGVLVFRDDYLDLFSLSFRQFVLSLPEGDSADKLAGIQKKFRIPGTWQSIRIPVITLLLIFGVFLFTTQPQVSTFLASLVVLAGSLTTILAFVRSSFAKT